MHTRVLDIVHNRMKVHILHVFTKANTCNHFKRTVQHIYSKQIFPIQIK